MPDLNGRSSRAGRIGRPDLVGYVRDLLDFATSVPDAALVRHDFEIGRMTLRARFSDPGLATTYATRLIPGSMPPDAFVDVLETKRLAFPRLARWSDSSCDRQCFHRTLAVTGLRAAYPNTADLWEVSAPDRRLSLQMAGDRNDLPVWDAGAPLRIPIHWACLDRGWRLLHGATIGDREKAVLLVGAGGTGKSGTVLAGIAHGLRTVGDDYVLVEPLDPPVARPVYRLHKQDPEGVARIAGLAERLAGHRQNWQGKFEFDPEKFFPGATVDRQNLAAILLPVLDYSAKTRIEPVGQEESLEALVRAAIEQFPGERDSGFLFCVGLNRRLPAFRLFLSTDAAEIAEALGRFVEEIGS